MHALLALALALTAQVACSNPARAGYEREIDSFQLPNKLFQYVLTNDNFSLKDRAKLITRPIPEDPIASDNVIVESNVLQLVSPSKRVRRGWNLEHVNVPAAYPYLPVPSYTRFRRRNDYPYWRTGY